MDDINSLAQSKYRCIGGYRFEVAHGSADDLLNKGLKDLTAHKIVSSAI